MGVIKNFDYGRTPPILRSSEESLNSSVGLSVPSTPPSEAEDVQGDHRDRSFFPRRRDPALLIQRLEVLSRKRTGARKARRDDNARALQILVENEDEVGACTPSIEDFIPASESPLTKLMTDFNSMRIWEFFMSQTEEEQKKYLDDISQNKRINRNFANFGIYFTQSNPNGSLDEDVKSKISLSADHRFTLIDSYLRSVLKRRNFPNNILTRLEDDIRDVFSKDRSAVYISKELSSFERLLLHAVSQFYLLKSCSFDVASSRRTKVQNLNGNFSFPKLSLTEYLEKRNQHRV